MKRTYLMIAAFFLLILGPNLLFPFFRNTEEENTGENRNLAAFPAFSPETVDTWPAAVEDYINDHAAFRNRFLSLNSVLNLKLFGYADSADVITGEDGWYFYAAGSSVEDFLGINVFSPQEQAKIAACVQAAGDALRERGTQLILLFAPNKESACTEYMPGYFKEKAPEGPTRRESLIACLQESTDVPLVDPYPLLRENRDYLWYYKSDTHWNDAAGFAASQMIIEAAGGTPTPLEQVRIAYEPAPNGDLAGLFHLPAGQAGDVKAVVTGYREDVSLEFTDENGDGNVVHMTATGAPDPRRIAVYRDSFGTALFSGLSLYFTHTDFYHWQSFDHRFLEENPPDILVYQVVERDLWRIPIDLKAIVPELS